MNISHFKFRIESGSLSTYEKRVFELFQELVVPPTMQTGITMGDNMQLSHLLYISFYSYPELCFPTEKPVHSELDEARTFQGQMSFSFERV